MSELTAIYYIWKRELIRFSRSKSRIIGSLAMPFFFLAIIGTGMGSLVKVGGGSYLDFMAPGILSMVVLFGSIFSGVIVIMDRQFGFLKETMVAPVKRTSIVIGKALGGATTAVIQGMLMLGIAMLLGAHIDMTDLLPVMALMFMVSVMFVSLGIAIASTMEDMHGFQLVMNFLVMPMFFLSGALFPLTAAPEPIRWLSYIDPMTYVVEAMRYLLVGSSTMPIAVSGGVLGFALVLSVLLATWLFNRIES